MGGTEGRGVEVEGGASPCADMEWELDGEAHSGQQAAAVAVERQDAEQWKMMRSRNQACALIWRAETLAWMAIEDFRLCVERGLVYAQEVALCASFESDMLVCSPIYTSWLRHTPNLDPRRQTSEEAYGSRLTPLGDKDADIDAPK